jgi:hypothetical protein
MNPFLLVVDALNRHRVRYVIVGGFAAVMHGADRATRDLDIFVDLAPDEARKAIEALLSVGLESRVPIDPYDFADPIQRQQWIKEKNALVFTMIDPKNPIFAVDLFVEPPMDADGLFARSKLIQIKDQAFRVCSLDDLIIMKQRSGRPQDLLDVDVLREIKSLRNEQTPE